jgi:hypothetical protein
MLQVECPPEPGGTCVWQTTAGEAVHNAERRVSLYSTAEPASVKPSSRVLTESEASHGLSLRVGDTVEVRLPVDMESQALWHAPAVVGDPLCVALPDGGGGALGLVGGRGPPECRLRVVGAQVSHCVCY